MQASARFSSSYTSTASKKVLAGISDAVARSWYRPRRGKTQVASLSAQDPPEVQKRVTKHERRARIEEFVENYRASHGGKFPSATSVRQQVGGSYYVACALVQELEYNSRLKGDVNRNTSFISEISSMDPSIRDGSASSKGTKEEMAKPSESLELKAQLSDCQGKTGSVKLDLSPTNVSEDESGPMSSSQTESNKVIDAENLKRPKHEYEGSISTDLWGSLKSFADGFRIFWKICKFFWLIGFTLSYSSFHGPVTQL